MSVVFSPAARDDLLDIWRSVAEHNVQAADKLYDEIQRRCSLLLDHPLMGVHRPQIGEGARLLVVRLWIVLYRASGSHVEIVRVLDGRRDLGKLMGPAED